MPEQIGGDSVNEAEEKRQQTRQARPPSNLPTLLGIGGGGLAGFLTAGASNVDISELGKLLSILLGSILGAILPWVGVFAWLGLIVGIVFAWLGRIVGIGGVLYTRMCLLCPAVVGSLLGLAWTFLQLSRSQRKTEPSASRHTRLRLAWTCLLLGPLVGLAWGLLLSDVVVASVFYGLAVGVTLFAALCLSALQ